MRNMSWAIDGGLEKRPWMRRLDVLGGHTPHLPSIPQWARRHAIGSRARHTKLKHAKGEDEGGNLSEAENELMLEGCVEELSNEGVVRLEMSRLECIGSEDQGEKRDRTIRIRKGVVETVRCGDEMAAEHMDHPQGSCFPRRSKGAPPSSVDLRAHGSAFLPAQLI